MRMTSMMAAALAASLASVPAQAQSTICNAALSAPG